MLESRHLVGLFLGVVLLCSVFFTLGYVMGRTQLGPPLPLHASASTRDIVTGVSPISPKPADGVTPQPDREWDFYDGKTSSRLQPSEPAPATTAPASAPAVASPNSSTANQVQHDAETSRPTQPVAKPVPVNATSAELRRFQPPRIPHGAVILQLAALSKETDALAMADAAQQKHFPSFVATPTGDKLYHVQVGPYADLPAAERAKDSLDHAGFKAIIKR